jgi:hypothetical protein
MRPWNTARAVLVAVVIVGILALAGAFAIAEGRRDERPSRGAPVIEPARAADRTP